jgi:hypothetical protein
MSIKSYLDELERIKLEIKNNNKRNKILKDRAKIVESNISDYLKCKQQNGLKYNGKTLLLENREKRKRKKEKDKKGDLINLLKDLGIKNIEKTYSEIIESQKGEIIDKDVLKFQK